MEVHLVILVHGLWGNLTHFNYVKNQLEATYNETQSDHSSQQLVVYKAGSNEGYKTYDGIDICGKRVAQEIEQEITRLESEENTKVTKISVIGYSLGGLIARYAIGILYHKNYFDKIEPLNFVTFCTPHVGVLTPGDGISIKFFNWLVPFLLANSGRQMFLKDKAKAIAPNSSPAVSRSNSSASLASLRQQDKIEQPLLSLMANPASIFYKSLKLFKYKSLYANVVNDKRTSWWTAGISAINPFEALDINPNIKIDKEGTLNFHNGNMFKMSYVSPYAPIIIDASRPLKIISSKAKDANKALGKQNPLLQNIPVAGSKQGETITDKEKSVATDYAENFFKRKFKWLIVIFNIVVYAPLWISWFILNNLIQRVKSGFRVLKESDASTFLELYQLAADDDEAEEKRNTDDRPAITRRPSLTRTLSETYGNLENRFEQNLEDQTDELMESVWDAMMSKKIEREQDMFWFNEEQNRQEQELLKNADVFVTSVNDLAVYDIDENGNGSGSMPATRASDKKGTEDESAALLSKTDEGLDGVLCHFKLKFNNHAQYDIIKNLNLLKWQKFPIYIQLTNATHAASIVRHHASNFTEGEVVVRQFCDDVMKYK